METRVEVRPWRPGDLVLLRDAESSFSPTALSSRFLVGTHRFPSAYLHRLERPFDPKRPWQGLVALADGKLVGIGECAWGPGADIEPAELAVLVADAWHRRGIGARLTCELLGACLNNGTT